MFSSFRVGLGAGGRGLCDRVLFRVTKSRVKNLEIVLARRPRPLTPRPTQNDENILNLFYPKVSFLLKSGKSVQKTFDLCQINDSNLTSNLMHSS